MTEFDYDVIIIGGGPGGSTTGTVLAQAGKKVLLLEKEKFPRFRIGESLLPFGNEVMEQIGVWEKVKAGGFMPKHGAEFTTGNSTRFLRIWFKNGLTPEYSDTFQVERSRFDELLLNHSRDCGCEVREGCAVKSVDIRADGSEVSYDDGGSPAKATCRWLVDASGRDAFLGKQFKISRSDLKLPKRIAVYAHYRGVYRNPGEAGGHITIVRIEGGWLWFIPLDEEKTSVGLVQTIDRVKSKGGRAEEIFEAAAQDNQELAFRLKNAQRITDYMTTGDYTYRHRRVVGPRWFLVGDAGGFIDPIFSSGVLVAMKTGQLAAGLLLEAEKRKRPLSAFQRWRYKRKLYSMTTLYLGMIRNFYTENGFEVLVNPFVNPTRSRWGIPAAVNSLLAGNTKFHFGLRWRLRTFFLLCRLQKWLRIVPRIDYKARGPKLEDPSEKPAAVAAAPL